MTLISSTANADFKSLRRLSESGRERRKRAAILLDGPHLVACYLDHCGPPDILAVTEAALEQREIADLLARCKGVRTLIFTPALFGHLAPVDTPVGILAIAPMPTSARSLATMSCVVVLDGVQDPGNVGGIIRTAAAAGVQQVLLSTGCADPWGPRALRAGMGAHFSVSIRTGTDLTVALTGRSGIVVATVARGGQPPQAIDLTGPTTFLFGGEGAGVAPEIQSLATAMVTIPMAPGIESLNVGAAAAIVLFERVRQLGDCRIP